MAKELLVLAEHRQGKLRDVSLEMLSRARKLAEAMGARTVAVLLGSGLDSVAGTLASYSDEVVYADDPGFADFNSDHYQRVLVNLLKDRRPALVMIAHSAAGADLAPALAVEARLPLVTDVIGIRYQDDSLYVTRQMFQGKVNADYSLHGAGTHLVTVREGSYPIAEPATPGAVVALTVPPPPSDALKKFIDYLEVEAGDVDITKSAALVAVGRGIKEAKNLKLIEELAAALGADVCGSRVAIDAGWLPQNRQVGITGKTVKPKLYIAIGISGSFQHLAGIKGAKTIVAINKDPKAPIFSVADFAIVDDLFSVVPKLTQKIKELKQ